MTPDLIKSRNDILSSDYKDFVYSDFTDVTVAIFGDYLKLDEEKRVIFENGLMLFLLLFLNKFEFIEFIIRECSLSIEKAISAVTAISEGLPVEMTTAMNAAKALLEKSDPSPVKESDRFNHLLTIPDTQLRTYLYAKTSSSLTKLHEIHSLNKDLQVDITDLIGDILLGFYKIEDTVPLLQQELKLDARTAALLGADVLDFLIPLTDPNFITPTEVTDEVIPLSTTNIPESVVRMTVISDYTTSPTQLIPTITTYQPAPTSSIAPELHTMAMDANAARANFQPVVEPVHSSEQPVTRTPLSDLPSYTSGAATPNSNAIPPIEPPRWGV